MFHIVLWFCLLSNMFVPSVQPRNFNIYKELLSSELFSSKNDKELFSNTEYLVFGAVICIIIYKTLINPQLSLAIGRQSVSLTKRAIAFGQDVNRPYWFTGTTPLHDAIERGSLEIVRLLLQQPTIEVEKTDYSGINPLQTALRTRNLHQKEIILSLLCANHSTHNYQSNQFLPKELRTLLEEFERAKNGEIQLYDLIETESVRSILYSGKFSDLIAFALRNNNQMGLEHCIKNKYCNTFDYNDVFMTLAENESLAKFFSIYGEKKTDVENLKKVYLHAKKNNNKRYMNAVKTYVSYLNTLQETKFRKQIGENILIKKVLSYINCDEVVC